VAPEDLTVGAATRAYPGETANGDAWQLDWHDGACRIAVIDGLGHGPEAAAAAQAALETLALRPELSPADALKACHTALAGTRGAAISIARIDTTSEQLTYAGIGNVDGHLLRQGRQERLTAQRGIVGAALPSVRPASYLLQAEWMLVMHTDGIRSRFHVEDLPSDLQTQPQQLAEVILGGWSRDTDDATVIVVVHQSEQVSAVSARR
jgi:serine phosphatase RsbU (regulator of sigma subunit)